MNKKEEFDLDFDFEKEFGIDPNTLLDPEDTADNAEDFDLSSLFAEVDAISGEDDALDFVPQFPKTDAAPEEDDVPESVPEVDEEPADALTGYQPIGDDEELDFLDDDFLASLGIVLKDEKEDEDVSAPEEEPDEEYLPVETPVAEHEEISQPEEEFEEDADTFEDDFEDDFDEILDAEDEDADMNIGFDFDNEPAQEIPSISFTPSSEPAFEVDTTPDLGEEFAATYDEVAKETEAANEEATEEAAAPDAPEEKKNDLASIPMRRRKLSKERLIKEVYLPPVIAGLALILILCFIGGAIGRVIKTNNDKQDALNASNEASVSALQQEVDLLLDEAEALANGYDYEAALAKLNSFSGDLTQYKSMVDAVSAYTQAKNQLTAMDDPSSIPNLSFHCLIADPSRAFTDEAYGASYNNNYVTIDEFSKILQQLYDKGYVLVDFDSFIVETTTEDGKTTYTTQPIYLPAGKKPIMLTETLVNYETFSIDSDGDGEADAGGAGFASKLIVDASGKIVNEMVDSSGNTVTGAYDFVPILEAFIAQHPDFSYRGARATLAVSGEDGVFGYRIMDSVKDDKGEDYYNQQVEGAKKIAQALRDAGYTIACYTYSNISYGEASATQIRADLDAWEREVVPVLGEIDVLVYAKSSDISAAGNYSGNKYNVLQDVGFKYYISAATSPWTECFTDYVRQSRIMVTGKQMMSAPSTFTNYFDASAVLNNQRGN